MRVFVALSGGVDSAVAAHILKEQGHEVTGAFIRVWQPDFLPCNQDEEERAAKRVAAHLGIPFMRCDLTTEYKRDVVDEMISEYAQGRTPNPDVLCNQHIKFGAFLDFATKHGAEMIATGHHARVHNSTLLRGVDSKKDQAYFLWKVSQEELACTLMPIGEMTKEEVREYAAAHDIPSAYKPDSQGLCFIGHVDMKEFLSHYIDPMPGDVVDTHNTVIGHHDGAAFVTIGQRGGFTVTNTSTDAHALYVVGKEGNTITVAPTMDAATAASDISLVNTIFRQPLEQKQYTCEIRYHGTPHTCTLVNSVVTLEEPLLVAAGQSVVIYDDDVCIGGGVVA